MVQFVGAGSGAKDLITVRGKRLLGQADVIIYAGSLVNPELLSYAKEGCAIYNSAGMTLEEVVRLMENAESEGKMTVRLHTGDPSIYGAVREQMDELDKRGIAYESCPGVSACFGAASVLNLEYTLPGICQSLIITRMAGKTEVPAKESIESFAAHQASMAIYLSAGHIGELGRRLVAGGFVKETPAALVYKATWQEEESYVCTVGTLADTAKKHGITKTALILVGEAIAHQNYQKSRLYAPDFSTGFRKRREEKDIGDVPKEKFSKKAEKQCLSVISFTRKGLYLSQQLARTFMDGGAEVEISLFTKFAGQIQEKGMRPPVFVEQSVSVWAGEQMKDRNALLFIGACGIAVRSVAPFLTSKLKDAPVLVMDEMGHHIIPILSGHLGGGNELALLLAERLGAGPVITTATDLHGKFAVDLFAKRNRLHIVNKEGIARVSAKILEGVEITIAIEDGHWDCREAGQEPGGVRMIPYPPAEPADVVISSKEDIMDAAILLTPKEYVIGFGCKKGKTEVEISRFIQQKMEELGILEKQIFALSSISHKQTEPGIVGWCKKRGIPFITYTAEELKQTKGTFHTSNFVEKQVGVDNVCERAALRNCGSNGVLVVEKCAKDGMAIAIAKWDWKVTFAEEYIDMKGYS